MLRYALRSLLARRGRSALTVVAVAIGVAIIAGTLLFTDTIDGALQRAYGASTAGAQVIVSSRDALPTGAGAGPAPGAGGPSIPASLVARIRHLAGVSAAEGRIVRTATVLSPEGYAPDSHGLPTYALSYLPPPLGGLRVIAGAAPAAPDQVLIDRGTARRFGYRVGDTVGIVTDQPLQHFQISGIASLQGASIGGAGLVAFTLHAAQALFGEPGRVDQVYVAALPGSSSAQLIDRIRPLLPASFQVQTAGGVAAAQALQASTRLRPLRDALLALGAIAVLVGAFAIFNAFAITLAQRAGELALLRALGAVRRQLLGALLAEGLLVGVLGSALGIGAGIGAALGIESALRAAGLSLPRGPLAIHAGTPLIALAVGLGATLLAAVAPAARAARGTPLESLREASASAAGGALRRARRPAGAAVLLAGAGVAVILTAGGSLSERLLRTGLGAVGLTAAVLLIAPLAVPAAARVLAPRDRPIARLASENAVRSPTRAALGASALTVGLALMVFVSTYEHSARAAQRATVTRSFAASFVIQSQDGSSPIPAAVAGAAAGTPDTLAISALRGAQAELRTPRGAAAVVQANGVDPTTFPSVYRFDWQRGGSAALTAPGALGSLGPAQALVEQDTARADGLRLGSQISLTAPTGTRVRLTVAGIYSDRALLPGVTVTQPVFTTLFPQPELRALLLRLTPGTSVQQAETQLTQALSAFPGVVVRSQAQLAALVAGRLNSALTLLYALLALTVVMALLGIVNSLSLQIHDRRRELGMLRAIGMSRAQARALIHRESLVGASVGTLAGVALGLALGWAAGRPLAAEGIAMSPVWPLVGAALAGGVAIGLLSSLPPARRAARLDILAAIAHE